MAGEFVARYGPWAVVAGASEGLGAAFAEILATRGLNLILLARRAEPLEATAQRLREQHNIAVRTLACDLARPDLAEALSNATAGIEIGLAVYNAAYTTIGAFVARPFDELLRVVDVNVRGPLAVARTLAPAMVERGRGGIVLVSSLAGWQGSPRIAAYAASKAFNIVLGESLWRELQPQGVDVLVVSAGAVRTPGYARTMARDAPGTLDARAVAKQALEGLGRGPVIVPGRVNRLARFVMGRLLPRRTAIAIMARSTKELS
jgi:short-subunit dehydrogenase